MIIDTTIILDSIVKMGQALEQKGLENFAINRLNDIKERVWTAPIQMRGEVYLLANQILKEDGK